MLPELCCISHTRQTVGHVMSAGYLIRLLAKHTRINGQKLEVWISATTRSRWKNKRKDKSVT